MADHDHKPGFALGQNKNPLLCKYATVQTAGYPPLTVDPLGRWRSVPWINLRGFWLEEFGFRRGQLYGIEAYEQCLVLSVK